jgi:predicted regulator of Ras-like GTPase activity (Roadblock/LC7/MglB family)
LSDKELVLKELKALREQVTGVSESLVATSDGLLVAADSSEIQAESVAALAAASLGLARRTAAEVRVGALREVVIRARTGHMAVYAVGPNALLAVLGDEGLDLDTLHTHSRTTTDRLAALLAADAEE